MKIAKMFRDGIKKKGRTRMEITLLTKFNGTFSNKLFYIIILSVRQQQIVSYINKANENKQ